MGHIRGGMDQTVPDAQRIWTDIEQIWGDFGVGSNFAAPEWAPLGITWGMSEHRAGENPWVRPGARSARVSARICPPELRSGRKVVAPAATMGRCGTHFGGRIAEFRRNPSVVRPIRCPPPSWLRGHSDDPDRPLSELSPENPRRRCWRGSPGNEQR